MDIKATQLKNNTQIATVDTTATRTPAKVTETGASFIDELSNIPSAEPQNKVETNIQPKDTNVTTKQDVSKNEYEFVSTTKDFSKTLNKENLTTSEKQTILKDAGKNVSDEIVLMNNKQDSKNVKAEIKTAQASVAVKTDNQIEAEKEDNKKSSKNDDFVGQHNFANSKEQNQTLQDSAQQNIQNLNKELPTIEEKTDIKENEASKIAINSETAKAETIAQKNTIEIGENKVESSKDITNAKEHIVTNDTKNIETTDFDKTLENRVENKATNNKKSVQAKVENKVINNKKPAQTNVENKVAKEENIIQPKVEKAVEETKINPIEMNNNSKISNILAEHELFDKKSTKDMTANKKAESIENTKKPLHIESNLNDVKNVDKLEKISKEINVEAIADKPVIEEKMTVIKYEPITPVMELDKSLNSSKTSDIVKFLDANLGTKATSKISKTSATKASEKASEKTIKMTEADAKFFNNLVENNQQVMDGTKTADATNTLKDVETAKNVQVSKSLLNALKESQENNKSFRVDFDNDLSVILKVNRDGKISAEFLPGDKAVEQYLKSNIPLLQQQFKDEGLEYENLSYRQRHKDDEDKQKQQHRNNKKENGYE